MKLFDFNKYYNMFSLKCFLVNVFYEMKQGNMIKTKI